MNIDLEIMLIKRFFLKQKQDRYIQFVSSKKNRNKFLLELSHFNSFNWNLLETVKGIESEVIKTRLKLIKGDKDSCYVISENADIDQQMLSIKEALDQTINSDFATILVFGDAELIYFEGEPPNNRYISKI